MLLDGAFDGQAGFVEPEVCRLKDALVGGAGDRVRCGQLFDSDPLEPVSFRARTGRTPAAAHMFPRATMLLLSPGAEQIQASESAYEATASPVALPQPEDGTHRRESQMRG